MEHLLLSHEKWKKKMFVSENASSAHSRSVLYESKSSLALYNLSEVEEADVGATRGREA